MSIWRTYKIEKTIKTKKIKKRKTPNHKKGSEWHSKQSRKEWLNEQGFENVDEYIDKIYEDMEKQKIKRE